MIQIEKNVVIPDKTKSSKYPWDKMNVGDSFFVADISITTLCAGASINAKRTGRKYTVRKVEGGAEVWRIE